MNQEQHFTLSQGNRKLITRQAIIVIILRGIFAQTGGPRTLSTDYGTQLTPVSFPISGLDARDPDCQQQSDGQAELLVKTLERALVMFHSTPGGSVPIS